MTGPMKPWESRGLQNNAPILRSSNGSIPNGQPLGRSVPVLPPRPLNSYSNNNYSAYNVPHSGYGGLGVGYGGYGSMNSYSSYGMPYRSSMYNSYGGMGGYTNGMYGTYPPDDAEQRFVQYAEESSRRTFANVEGIVRAVNSISMMLDNTFFAMTSSFRAVLSVAENFGRLRTMFGHIWYSINIFRMFSWLYKRLMELVGVKVRKSPTSVAWNQATGGHAASSAGGLPSGSNWPTIAFLGVLVSAPYIISRFLPKYEDKSDVNKWKSPGIKAKAAFDFVATTTSELSIKTNDEIILAPTYIQESMNLKNTGWAFAVSNGKSGTIPLNYVVLNKTKPLMEKMTTPVLKNSSLSDNHMPRTHTKRVSFGENQIFEDVDLADYINISEKVPTSDGNTEKSSQCSEESSS